MRLQWEYRPLMVSIGEGAQGGGGLHIPKTLPEGIFSGERGVGVGLDVAILDDGKPYGLPGAFSVDHDARLLRNLKQQVITPPASFPPAVLFERTAARRSLRPPTTDNGAGEVTRWTYTSGQERAVTLYNTRTESRRLFNEVIPYDGSAGSIEEVSTVSRNLTDYDFGWTTNIFSAGVIVARDAVAYRTVSASYPGQGSLLTDSLIQVLVEDVWIDGDWEIGRTTLRAEREIEVTAVLEKESQDGSVVRTRVNFWTTIARLTQQVNIPGFGFDGTVPDDATPEYTLFQGAGSYTLTGWVRWRPSAAATTLRDVEVEPFPPQDEPDGNRWKGAGGAITVSGPSNNNPASLEGATLTAYGHVFTGGTWAALRDLPTVQEDGIADFSPHLILHASSSLVSSVRPNGQLSSIPKGVFETEVLRLQPGGFQGFSAVGSLFNTWPPQWAWAQCQAGPINEMRAVAVHQAWRDSYKYLRDAPLGSPTHWVWPGRPNRPPGLNATGGPVAPLRLTLADVTGVVEHDEALSRGEGIMLLPTAAMSGLNDARAAVAKRVLYQPAGWLEELDDRRSAAGPLNLTFELPDPPGAGQEWAAALVLRLKTTDTQIAVNGQLIELGRLGHNAGQRRGWHPYVVPVPVASTYALEYTGRCSRALLCVRVFDVASPPAP